MKNITTSSRVNDIILMGLRRKKIKKTELADLLDLTPRTLENRWRNPGNWTQNQLNLICKILELDDADIIAIIRDN